MPPEAREALAAIATLDAVGARKWKSGLGRRRRMRLRSALMRLDADAYADRARGCWTGCGCCRLGHVPTA